MNKARDMQYFNLPTNRQELDHAYGDNIHIVSSPVMMTGLMKACAKSGRQPEINRIFTELYIDLMKAVINAEFPQTVVDVPTRMIDVNDKGYYHGSALDPEIQVAIAVVARAGILPSQVVFDRLNLLLNPERVRLDHFFVARDTDADHHVTGAQVFSSKIGGPLDDAILLLPDPMGATGSSVVQTLQTYKKAQGAFNPKKVIAMHLIITPEYIRKIKQAFPGIIVYAIRLDRGLSPADVLAEKPGVRWDEERGLNDVGYIVPGGGGIGEVMTNSWV